MEFKDYYQVLGVDPGATADEIKKAFRKLARQYPPDVSKAPDAEQRMAQLNEAYTVLSDPEKRAAYDALSAQAAAQGARSGGDFHPPPHWDAGFAFSDASDPYDGAGSGQHSDFFEQLFGQAARAYRRQGSPAGGAQRGADQHARIELDIPDAYQGGTRTIHLRTAHLDAGGHVVPEQRSLEVKIPKGMREGQLIRLAGQGNPGLGGAPAGDLFLEVLFRPDPRWRAEGRDVVQPLMVAPWEVALGASVQVQTPDATAIEVSVPAGWKPGRKLRLKGRGIPSSTPGDLYLELGVALPPADTDTARAAWAALGKAFPHFNPRQAKAAQGA